MTHSAEVLAIPRFSLVVLMGPSASGKTTFAGRWFPESSIVSSDRCRWMVANDEAAEWASAEAFALLETWVTARLKLGQLTVVDSTALEPRFRMRMLDLAREFHAPAILLAFDVPQRQCAERDEARERRVGLEVIGRHVQRFYRALSRARDEGWNRIVRLRPGEIEQAQVEVRPLRVDCSVPPPYDLIGDIHGCYGELCELLDRLGYVPDPEVGYRHPEGRRIVFVGDLVDRGPASLKVLELASRMHRSGTALVTPGNHDDKLLRFLGGGRVRMDHGLERTAAELEALEPAERARFVAEMMSWLKGLPPYLMLDDGRLVVAHAGLPEYLHGRLSRAVAAWALYGEARGQRFAGGAASRVVEWPITYQGKALVVYGHTPSADARMRGNTLCIDQGCVFGGKLTAYRYPEGALVQVAAREIYYPEDAPDLDGSASPTAEGAADGDNGGTDSTTPDDGVLSASDRDGANPDHGTPAELVEPIDGQGPGIDIDAREEENGFDHPADDTAPARRQFRPDREARRPPPVELPNLLPLLEGAGMLTQWLGQVSLKSQLVSDALEQLARSAVDPRWIVFMPPTIAVCASSPRPDYLEHPYEVLQYYRSAGIPIVMEEMHPGCRSVVIIGRDEQVCLERFGMKSRGMIYGRGGQPVLQSELLEPMLDRIGTELERVKAFERLKTRLLIFEASLMPWSLAHQEFLARQCIPAASALLASRDRALEAIDLAKARGVPIKPIRAPAERDREGARSLNRMLEACVWPVKTVDSVRIAPYQLLATDGRAFVGHERLELLQELERWCGGSTVLTPIRRVVVRAPGEERAAVSLWEDICGASGGGMVARTNQWFPRSGERPELPAMKVRGREFLRLLFGAQYLNPEVLDRLKDRPLRTARTMALREWALASEGLSRFAEGASFAEYHPYALAVLSSQQEPIDPRL